MKKEENKSALMRFMGGVERIGNKLPHPFYLFALLAVVAVVLSVLFNGASVTYEMASSSGGAATTATATVKNLLNRETISYVITNLYKIYFSFSPMMMMQAFWDVQRLRPHSLRHWDTTHGSVSFWPMRQATQVCLQIFSQVKWTYYW